MSQLTDSEAWAIANALRAAAIGYDDSAKIFDADEGNAGHKRLAQGFRDQATQARAMADRFEGASTVTVTD